MAFHGFSAEGVDLLQLNRLQNSKEFYDAHKDEIKRLSIRPFHELIAEMTPEMVKIDPQFVTVPSRMVSRVRRDTRYTKDKTLYRANMWLFFRRARRERGSVPAYYFELHPEYWAFGCWGAWGRGEMASVRPPAPMRWPVADLVELIGGALSRPPNTALTASVSALSPSGVDVPCALI